jgi:hypothetical protein
VGKMPIPAVSSPWDTLISVANKWMYKPDIQALRAILCSVKALDLDTTPLWMMLIGTAGTGKTSFYLKCCEAYYPHVLTDDVTQAGMLSGSKGSFGMGVLSRLGSKGLWIISDFTTFLNLDERKRGEIMGMHRRIYDGKYDRSLDGRHVSWSGRVHMVSGVTPAIERFYRLHADLGERWLQVRIEKHPPSNELLEKVALQRERYAEFQESVVSAANPILSCTSTAPKTPVEIERQILDWAEFIAIGRTAVTRNYRDEIIAVANVESNTRICQQLLGLAQADAMLLNRSEVSQEQLSLVERVAFDCLPINRRAVLLYFRTSEALSTTDLRELSGITHNYTFSRTMDELVSIGAIEKLSSSLRPQAWYKLTPWLSKFLS